MLVTVLMVVVAFALAIVENPTMSSFVLSGAVPVTPLLLWGVREWNRQTDASVLVERLKAHVGKLWEVDAPAGESDPMATNRMPGRCAASQIAAASAASFLFDFASGRTNLAAMSRTSWPSRVRRPPDVWFWLLRWNGRLPPERAARRRGLPFRNMPHWWFGSPALKENQMEPTTIAIDLAKRVFQIHSWGCPSPKASHWLIADGM